MANILFKTKGGASPKGKPRIYFTCHPDDLSRSFEKICADIFATHDCAIYYKDDMTGSVDAEYREADLGSMNLFVIPVSFRLLTQDCEAMEEFYYAKSKHIPVLPIMLETGIDAFYSKPDKFGEMQYMNPYSTDRTEISYSEKLKKYLESVLISDEMVKRVKAAFDAYIFLSYRKKDRQYANELMRMIHNIQGFRDIAIWYDEFLTPGESFEKNIRAMLDKSEFFTLLVTPNLLEEPNFVMDHEYPEARYSGKNIIPTEMAETDREKLREKYKGIPECVNPAEEAFINRYAEMLSRIAKAENDNDPEHNFLIGLAYLEGIDVETDREKGLELITSAAEVGLPEAMGTLYNMYSEGTGVKLSYKEALKWAHRLADYYTEKYGEEDKNALLWRHNLASMYGEHGEYKKSLELYEKVYKSRKRILVEEHPSTLTTLNNLASMYGKLGEYKKSLELKEKVCESRKRILGEEHPDTLTTLNGLAYTYGNLGEYKKSLEIQEKVYEAQKRILGEEHPDTLASLSNLAYTYSQLGEHRKSLELQEKVYESRKRILGEEHPDTLASLSNLACTYTYCQLGEHKKSLELFERVYESEKRILGEEHPDTLTTLNNLAYMYGKLGEHKKSLELYEKVYESRKRILGEEHPDTLTTLNNLASMYGKLGEHKKSLELFEKVYEAQKRILGEEHPSTLITLNNLAMTYGDIGEHKKSLELYEKVYESRKRILGEEHPDTLTTLNNLAVMYYQLGKHKKSLELFEKVYEAQKRILGEEHPDTLTTLENLTYIHKKTRGLRGFLSKLFRKK